TTVTPNSKAEIGTVNTAATVTVVGFDINLTGLGSTPGGIFVNAPGAANNVALLASHDISADAGVSVLTNGAEILMVAGAGISNDPITNVITINASLANFGSILFGPANAI